MYCHEGTVNFNMTFTLKDMRNSSLRYSFPSIKRNSPISERGGDILMSNNRCFIFWFEYTKLYGQRKNLNEND